MNHNHLNFDELPVYADAIFHDADFRWGRAWCCDTSGTTATVTIVDTEKVTVAHVGNSSALLITVDADGVRHGSLTDLRCLLAWQHSRTARENVEVIPSSSARLPW